MAQSYYYGKLKYGEWLKGKMMKCYRHPQDISLAVVLVLQQGNLQLEMICCSKDASKPGITSCEAQKAPEEYKYVTKTPVSTAKTNFPEKPWKLSTFKPS